MSLEPCPRVLLGGTLIDGTGSPYLKDCVVIIEGEWIKAVGVKEKLEIPENSEIYDTSGMTITPGLIDSHVHFLSMGVKMLKKVDMSTAKSLDEALDLVKEKVQETESSEWVIGRGWDESKWSEKKYITKEDLDEWSGNNPLMLVRVCGHLLTLNTRALEMTGITKDTKSPRGGQIDKGEDGEPTGVLRDCRYLVQRHIDEPTHDDLVEALELASDHALSLGCTSIHDAGIGREAISAYQSALEEGKLKTRSYVMLRDGTPQGAINLGIKTGFGNQMLNIGSVKLMMDGSIGARTAALFEPYEDDPSTKGLLFMEPEELVEEVKKAHDNNFQAAIHAIGDLAIEHVIDSIQEVLRQNPKKNHRHRIEHCELLSSQQIERINQLGIVASMQPNFIGEWGGPEKMYETRIGSDRDRSNNPYRSLIDEGVKLCFGSDGMPFNPIYGISSAVNHPYKHNSITLEEAVKCYTLNSAYAGFEEDLKGSIEPGKLADITIFDRDLLEIPKDEIQDAEVYMTLVGGKILYHKEA